MRVMQFPLQILTVAGCWPPISWSSLSKKRMAYNVYTIFVTLLLFTFMLPQFLYIILNSDNPDDFTETFYVNLALIIACCKMLGLLMNRKNIEKLTDALIEKPFRPLEPDEVKIRQEFDDMIQSKSKLYTFTIEATCTCMNVTTLFTNFQNGELAYKEWVPYELSDIMYYIIYFRQLIGLTAASIVNVACDCTICGLFLHICCQIEILKCRLRKSLREQSNLGECICQHECIFKFADIINEKFRVIIAIQFAVSTLVLCSSMYQLATTPLNAEFVPLILYATCMCMQILIYCWYANEVKLKSIELADDVFQMNWIAVDKRMKRSLIMIMNCSLTPVEFSTAYIITVNLESFVMLLKISYSAYSLLQCF